ncbi:MAG: sulfatase, partial [Nitrospirae bacterium]|nr:sulfatase [Nitrospirota bacterium]
MAKNIILISIDTLRYDCVGYQPDKSELEYYDVLKYLNTPTLDRIAEKSLCFTQCISTNTYTPAAHASIFTGLYPPGHGVREFYGKKLSNNVYPLAEVLKVHGYNTVMFTDTPHHFHYTGLERGFDHVIARDEERLYELLKTKDFDRNSQHFIFAHFFDVHEPYLASENEKYNDGSYMSSMEKLYEECEVPFNKSLYSKSRKYLVWDNFIDYVGRKINLFFPLYVRGVSKFDTGRFKDFIQTLEHLGVMDDAVIIIVADHGEGRRNDNDRECFGHSGPLFDNVLRVPLILSCEEITPGVSDSLVSIVDIFPTVLRIALNKSPQELLPYTINGVIMLDPLNDRKVYSETWSMDCEDKHWNLDMTSYLLYQRALRTESHKYIVYGMPEKFNDINSNSTPDEDFLQDYYRCLLCEFESYDRFIEQLTALQKKSLKREDLLASNSKQVYCFYDLKKDPREFNPVFLSGASLTDAGDFYQDIFTMEKKASHTEQIFDEYDKDALREIAKKLFLKETDDIILTLLSNKHLLSNLIDRVIFNPVLSDEDFIKSVYAVFFNGVPSEREQKEASEFFQGGLSRKMYFNKKVFGGKTFISVCRGIVSEEDIYSRIMELEDYKHKYKEIEGSRFFKIFTVITRLIDNGLFPQGTRRRRFYSKLIKRTQGP